MYVPDWSVELPPSPKNHSKELALEERFSRAIEVPSVIIRKFAVGPTPVAMREFKVRVSLPAGAKAINSTSNVPADV